MKKILSLTLVAIMLLSTFMLTSCDEEIKMLNDFMNSQTTTESSNTTTAPDEIRYTVTKEEWDDILQSKNFTYTQQVGTYKQTVSFSVAGVEVKLDGVIGAYYVTIDGVDYMFTLDRYGEWVKRDSDILISSITLNEVLSRQSIDLTSLFEMAEYNKETKTYLWREGTTQLEFYFENGKLVYMSGKEADTEMLRIENVGITTVEIPDFNAGTDDDDETKELEYTLNDEGTGYIVTGIGDYAWSYDAVNIVIPDTYEGLPVVAIGDQAFYKDRAYQRVKSVVIPASVTTIGEDAFLFCRILESVVFAENSQLISIGVFAFDQCSNLTSIDLPDGVQYIGDAAFRGCNLLKTIDLGTSLEYLGEGAFNGCTVLNDVVIPETVTTIQSAAFQNCKGLTNIVIHDNIDTIEEWAFRGATALRSIFIPVTVVNMGEHVFSECDITIYCEAASAPEGWDANWNQSYDEQNADYYYFEPLWGQSAQ